MSCICHFAFVSFILFSTSPAFHFYLQFLFIQYSLYSLESGYFKEHFFSLGEMDYKMWSTSGNVSCSTLRRIVLWYEKSPFHVASLQFGIWLVTELLFVNLSHCKFSFCVACETIWFIYKLPRFYVYLGNASSEANFTRFHSNLTMGPKKKPKNPPASNHVCHHSFLGQHLCSNNMFWPESYIAILKYIPVLIFLFYFVLSLH